MVQSEHNVIYKFDGGYWAGRPKLTWKKLMEKDCREWKLTTVDSQERSTWRSGVRSAMHAASQLPGLILRIWGAKEKYFQGAEEFSFGDLGR